MQYNFFLVFRSNVFSSSFVAYSSQAPYLVTNTALELIVFTLLPEFVLDFRISFILQKYSFLTFFFICKFLNPSASNIPKYLHLSLSSRHFMTSLFGSCIPSLLDIILLFIITVACMRTYPEFHMNVFVEYSYCAD